MYKELENLIGESITYKQICELTGIKYYTGGKSKKLQIEDIERYYKLEKVKTKYNIIEKYEKPLEKIDNRCNGNNTKYGDDIETILLYKLQNEESDVYECTISQALLLCNLINKNYNIGRKDIPLTSKVLELDERNVYGFYDNTSRKLKDTFERALNRMRGKALISYEKRTKVVYKEVYIYENEYGMPIVNEHDKLSYNINNIHRYATEEERGIIIDCEAYALNELGYSSKQEVFLSHMWNEYVKILNRKLLELANIKYYYEVYNIVINHAQVNRVIERKEKESAGELLNFTIVSSLQESLDKKNNELAFMDNDMRKRLDKFIEDTNKMIDLTINNDCNENLQECIEKYNNKIKQEKLLNKTIENKPQIVYECDENIPF